MGQSWWNCEVGVWGRFGGIVKTMCGTVGGIVKVVFCGRVGGNVKVVFGADLVEL